MISTGIDEGALTGALRGEALALRGRARRRAACGARGGRGKRAGGHEADRRSGVAVPDLDDRERTDPARRGGGAAATASGMLTLRKAERTMMAPRMYCG